MQEYSRKYPDAWRASRSLLFVLETTVSRISGPTFTSSRVP